MFILCIYHVSKQIYTIPNLGIAASLNFGERTAGTLSRALGAHGTDWVRMTMENGEDVIAKTGSATEFMKIAQVLHELRVLSFNRYCKIVPRSQYVWFVEVQRIDESNGSQIQ